MRAVAIDSFGGPEKLKLTDLPRPRPGTGEILIRTVAAGVNPVDWKIREGLLKDRFPHAFPLVPGWDVAGVVEELGDGTGRFRKGDKVWAYARRRVVQWGTYAEFVAVPEESAALMPSTLLFEEAAALPLAALTAWQALFDKAQVQAGSAVLIHAAAGGVGHFAVQLAAGAGARVLGSAGPQNQSFVLSLGAAAAIDYTREDLREAVGRLCPEGMDVILDAVGGETSRRSLEVLRPGGILVSIVGGTDAAAAAERRVRATAFLVEPSGEQLKVLGGLVDRGKLRVHVSRIRPLAEAAEAQRESQAGHVRGKLVLAL